MGGQLTKRDHIRKESPGLQGLGEPVYSSLHDFHIGVVVLLDRIPITDHQDDSTRSPERTRGQTCPASYCSLLSNLPSQGTWVGYNPRHELGSLLF